MTPSLANWTECRVNNICNLCSLPNPLCTVSQVSSCQRGRFRSNRGFGGNFTTGAVMAICLDVGPGPFRLCIEVLVTLSFPSRAQAGIMMVVRRRAALLSLVLVLALASGAYAKQDSREVHIRLQSAAKASTNLQLMFAVCASRAYAQYRPGCSSAPLHPTPRRNVSAVGSRLQTCMPRISYTQLSYQSCAGRRTLCMGKRCRACSA